MNRNLNSLKLNLKTSKQIYFAKKKQNLHSINSNIVSNRQLNEIKWPTKEIRKSFLDHFCVKNKHKFIYSSSVIPRKGSGTYFTNAGMNQFKSIILGEVCASDVIDYEKYIGAANSQKCIRIGGKHSDLDSIGKDDYHHTFFEMLGNWSFGQYGKEDACRYALELLIDIYKLDIKRLYFTYFDGNKDLCLSRDLETRNTWLKLGVPEANILPFGMRENFWEMDNTGPCGPCTEIHYDRTNTGASYLVNKGDNRVIELWNLVFMQYNRLSKTSFINLPQLVVDTGMGLERLSAVLNNFNSNYEIDLFLPIFKQIESYLKNININLPSFHDCINDEILKSGYRTLGDHMRTITVCISDGLIPTRTGLGSYLRYLILKCMRLCNDVFKVEKNQSEFLCSLVPIIVDTLKDAYPQLESDCERIQEVIRSTEVKQQNKLKRSEEICHRFLNKLNNPKALSGDELWKLYKGDGSGEDVPMEFIEKYAAQNSIKLDREGFDKILIDETEYSLKNLKHTRTENTQLINICSQMKQVHHVPPTNDEFKYHFDLDITKHVARFKEEDFIAKIVCLIRINDDEGYEIVDHIENGDKCIVVLDRTNFYSEKGGQQSDNGVLNLLKDSNLSVKITHVQHLQDYSFHFGKLKIAKESLKELKIHKNDFCNLKIDERKRYQTTLNHTGVHLLNDTLRTFYQNDNSIIQTRSQAKDHGFKLEFLFNQIAKFSKPSLEDVENIQNLAQQVIDQALPIYENEVDFDKIGDYRIRILRDVLYPKRVRVISVGKPLVEDPKGIEGSFHELCCGTHATNTRDLKRLTITNINANGDFTYEFDVCVDKKATEIERNERIIADIYQEISETDASTLHGLHDIARKCIQIELLTQHWPLSYTFKQKLKKNLEKYRPSKYKLQKHLHKYFHEQIFLDQIIDAEDLYLKLITYNSILPIDQTLQALKQISNIPNSLLLFNQFRKFLIAYSYNNEENIDINEHEKLFNSIEKLLTQNKIIYEKVKHNQHPNIIVFKFDQRTKPDAITEICKNIEKI